MTFPATPLPIVQQLYIDGAWVDISADTRGAGGAGGVTITRGYSGDQAQLASGQTQFTLNNRDGNYTNDNPTSPYYRLLGRNTPYRTGVDTGVMSARYLDSATAGTSTYDGTRMWTADKAGIDITGDIDVSADFDPKDWKGRNGYLLASKYAITGNQRSWTFGVDQFGRPAFIWTTDGTTATRIFAICPTPIDVYGRVQIRAQLDVNNGSGGWTCNFYYSRLTNLAGPFTLLGTATGTGTTSIYSSTANLEVGTIDEGNTWTTLGSTSATGVDFDPFVGKMYAFVLRSGIAGSVVALADATVRSTGDTSWSDGAGNTWDTAGTLEFETVDFRFYGEVPSLPNRWDSSGTDIYIPVTANDVVARLTSGSNSKPLESAVKRNLKQFAWAGYWPLEQPFDSTTISAYLGQSGTLSNANFATAPTDFPGTAGSLNFSDDTGTARALCVVPTSNTSTGTSLFYFKLDALVTGQQTLIQFNFANGAAASIKIQCTSTTFVIVITSPDGTELVNLASNFGSGVTPIAWTAMRVKQTVSAGTVTWEWGWYPLGGAVFYGTSGTYSGSTVGKPQGWSSPGFTGKFNMQLAHIAMGDFDFDFTSFDFYSSTNAYTNEAWDDRARRLGAQQNFPVYIEGQLGNWARTELGAATAMGPQGLKTFVELLQECALVAGGILYAPRDKAGLAVRSWEQMVNQDFAEFDYSLAHLSGQLQPDPGLFQVINDVTMQSPDGSSYRYAKTSGELNTGDPASDPDAVGVYDVGPLAINLHSPNDLPRYTQRTVAQGTVDKARYPQVQIQLERAPFTASTDLTEAARRIDLGRPFQIANPPAWLPPYPIGLMTTGYVEQMGGMTDTIVFNALPIEQYRAGTWGSDDLPTTSLWGAASTTVKTGVNSTATTIIFTTPDVLEVWPTGAVTVLVEISGEWISCTNFGARSGTGPYDYSVTVTRSVNGVAKALTAGDSVTVVNEGTWS